ncbi:HBR374Cp [Eremothecium sinecaudum]|uniref:DNA mismatch repair protein HSM3 n=1 Tax=Eremothecium sinecaudum TaxID=45286 RepID=A0A120K1D8_9SACH|nr:HBR374Cp [Eremothecium sinecaudum]AMD19275.1 HBR374Cp [Eremothecium sinecaudum]
MEDLITGLGQPLQDLTDRNIAELNTLIESAQLSLISASSSEVDFKRSMTAIKDALLGASDDRLNYTALISLLDSIVRISSFEDVLQVFTVDDLIKALESDIIPLIQCACKVVSVSYPKDIFATTRIVDVMLHLYFSEKSSAVTSIEKVFQSLCGNKLIRRRILENNYPLLKQMRETNDAILFSRFLELLSILFQNIDYSEFLKDLFILTEDEIKLSLYKDIFLFINITKYHQFLLMFSNQINCNTGLKHWALPYLLPNMKVFGCIYQNKEKYAEVHNFASAYLFQLFKTVSYLDDIEVFHDLDLMYVHISAENTDLLQLLATINPAYFVNFYPELLKTYVVVRPSQLQVIKNVLSCESAFELVKPNISSTAILSMHYSEQMLLLEHLTLYNYATEYLLQDLPKVMSNLITNENGPVTEPHTLEVRKKVFENLLKCSAAVLNVWYEPLTAEYTNMCLGKTSVPTTKVASMYSQ